MPTVKPRLTLTLQPHRADLLRRLAVLQGTSAASVVTETMELVYPVLERVCVVLEAAQKAQETRRDGLREAVAKAEAELSPLLYEVASQFDLFIDQTAHSLGTELPRTDMADQLREIMEGKPKGSAGGAPACGGASAEQGANPRICNTGVRSPETRITPSPAKALKGRKS